MTKGIVKSKMVIEEEYKPDSMKHGNNHANSNHDKMQKHDQHNQHQKRHQQPSSMGYNINLKYDPVTPEPGKATKLILSITQQRSGAPVREYELVHDKLMHVITTLT